MSEEPNIRIIALNYAAQACAADVAAYATDLVMVARQIYLYLTKQDPVLDGVFDVNDDLNVESAEVISFIEYATGNHDD